MSRFIESLKILDGKVMLLPFHEKRYQQTCSHFSLCSHNSLETLINIPKKYTKGVVKCRVLYGESSLKIDFSFYSFREIKSLKTVPSDTINYAFKSENRTEINTLFTKKGENDDILIIKNGLLTDTSYANVLLYNGSRWVTPKRPLLKGVQREFLLENKKISAEDIPIESLSNYKKIRLVNALNSFEDARDITINAIS